MIVRDNRPGHPPDGTVRADRRSCDPFRRSAGLVSPKKLSDAELLCLAIAQVLLGFARGERHWGIRYAHAHLRHLFPYIPQQSGYNKRLRAAGAR